ncbi:MAG: two-component system, OmpR family, sensor kinase, partial [Chloroflexota bacterium]|nr:two-component system, OmpR family, sensor kinase [Chloroflexota bacterium]
AIVVAVPPTATTSSKLPGWAVVLLVLYFFVLEVYAAVSFVQAARYSGGVTRRRMQAVAVGSLCIGIVILLSIPETLAPETSGFWSAIGLGFSLAAGAAFFAGFATPAFLRRAWQEPELRAFLGRAASLPRLPNTTAIVRELERGAAAATGAPNASIGLWSPDEGVLRFSVLGSSPRLSVANGSEAEELAAGAHELVGRPGDQGIAGRSFLTQRPIFVGNAMREDPVNAARYQASGASALLAAPITAGDKHLGVLAVYAPRAPIFAEDDLVLVQLLADQAAVILESRALIDEAARVQAREEATRLKDDFLSAAAHVLKTPLTTLVAQTQLLERRALRSPSDPPDLAGIRRLVTEAKRLNRLVLELLDVSRASQTGFVGERAPIDLVPLAREVCARYGDGHHHLEVDAPPAVVGELDGDRIRQLFENLVENAVKYSPDGGSVRVALAIDDGEIHLTVTDWGIGISPGDLPLIFDRFQRGKNVDDRRFAGMGLGLYICRQIVEQHGGHLSVSSEGVGRGSTFHVMLPVVTNPAASGAVLSA